MEEIAQLTQKLDENVNQIEEFEERIPDMRTKSAETLLRVSSFPLADLSVVLNEMQALQCSSEEKILEGENIKNELMKIQTEGKPVEEYEAALEHVSLL